MEQIPDINRKKKIHVGFLILLMLFGLSHLVLYEMAKIGLWKISEQGVSMILGAIAMGLTILSVLFIKYFIKKKWLFVIYIMLFAVCVVFQISTLRLDISVGRNTLQHHLLLWALIISVFIFFTILFIMIRDIFIEKHDITYSLIGAANIFLSLIVTFSFILSIFILAYPTLIPGVTTVNEIYNIAFVISSYSIAGIDFPYNNVPQILKNITTFESIIVHLYAVMIVGRLLSR